jgi:hypothetical protein
MRRRKSARTLDAVALSSILCAIGAVALLEARAPQSAPQAETPADARIWLGRAPEIEAYLRTATIVKLDELSVGVTKPKKATLAPGGPVGFLAWKVIPPGRYGGAWESYLSEIAAYELDKLLELNMVPPTVEKVYKGDRGAAVMWASPTKSFKEFGGKGAPTPPGVAVPKWTRQLVRAKMFDNLIQNIDPNLGNWLVDPAWNLILIDHSRCFTTSKDMAHEMTRVDPDLWQKMLALNEAQLRPVIGKLMDGGQFRALLERRDKMRQVVADLVKARGEDYVFMRDIGGDAPMSSSAIAPVAAVQPRR